MTTSSPASHHADLSASPSANPPSCPPSCPWPAIAAAQQRLVPRVPFTVAQHPSDAANPAEAARAAAPHLAGSVARAHLEALARWPEALRVDDQAVSLTLPATERTTFFAQANAVLRDAGLITAWRNETYPVLAHETRELLATFERAASRFWGTITFGAHCNGFVADAEGRPERLWIARRAMSKATDPGLLDNLIGGGVPHGQSPFETVVREGWEEAGLTPAQMRGLRPGRLLLVARDIPEGFMLEWISVFDLALPPGLTPCNQDGEVAELHCLAIDEALAHAAGPGMTVDAALVTLDFALRHRLLPPDQHRALTTQSQPLWLGQAEAH